MVGLHYVPYFKILNDGTFIFVECIRL